LLVVAEWAPRKPSQRPSSGQAGAVGRQEAGVEKRPLETVSKTALAENGPLGAADTGLFSFPTAFFRFQGSRPLDGFDHREGAFEAVGHVLAPRPVEPQFGRLVCNPHRWAPDHFGAKTDSRLFLSGPQKPNRVSTGPNLISWKDTPSSETSSPGAAFAWAVRSQPSEQWTRMEVPSSRPLATSFAARRRETRCLSHAESSTLERTASSGPASASIKAFCESRTV